MFLGTLKVKKSEKNPEFIYDIEGGRSIADKHLLRLHTANVEEKRYLQSSSYPNVNTPLFELQGTRLVTMSHNSVSVECLLKYDLIPKVQKKGEKVVKSFVPEGYEEVEGYVYKAQPLEFNEELFLSLGALMQYAMTECKKENSVTYSCLDLASGEFVPQAVQVYNIPYPQDKTKFFGTVELTRGDITEMHLESPLLKLDFVTVSEDSLEWKDIVLSYNLGAGKAYGSAVIKLSEKSLGVPYIEKVVDYSKFDEAEGMFTTLAQVIAAYPEKEFEWLREKDYQIVNDDNLERICDYILNYDGYVYYDTETSGLKINFKSRIGQGDQLVGVVLSVKYGESFFFPTKMKSMPNMCGGDDHYFMEHYMRPILEGKELVAHNGSFDWKVAHIYGINANIVHDTMLLLKVTIQAEHRHERVGLKATAKKFLGHDSLELSDFILDGKWGSGSIRFQDLSAELVRYYACADTDNTRGLLKYAEATNLLASYNATKAYEIEVSFSLAVAYQEFYGFQLNVEELGDVRKELQIGQDNALAKMESLCGHKLNPNSSQQLQVVLYNEFNFKEQYGKEGKVTADAGALKRLLSYCTEGTIKYEFLYNLRDYKTNEAIRKVIDKAPKYMTLDGFIFPDVSQMGAQTGRVSVKNPNYQSYNDAVKKRVIPRKGYWMFDTDYSSVESRILANMVGNKNLMTQFCSPYFDYHTYQAAHMYGVSYAAVTYVMRKHAKSINFGLPYGMGDATLGDTIFGERTKENTAKAAELRKLFFKGQEDIRDWFTKYRDNGVYLGYTETLFGHRRYYDRNVEQEGSIRREAGNHVIQGTAADLYKIAVARVFRMISRRGWLGKVLFSGFIHDELLGEVSDDIDKAVFLKALREEFEVKVTGLDGTPWSPLYMGFGYGSCWYEAKSVELSIPLQWEIVERYGETGFPQKFKNNKEFFDFVPRMIRDFDVRSIKGRLVLPEAQGKGIELALNKELIAMVSDDVVEYKQCLEDKNLGEHFFSDFLRDENGEIIEEFECSEATQTCIDLFCRLHGVDRASVNLKDIEFAEADTSDEKKDIKNHVINPSAYETEYKKTALDMQEDIDAKIDGLGYYIDFANSTIMFKYVEGPCIPAIFSALDSDPSGLKVYLKNLDTNVVYKAPEGKFLNTKEVSKLQQMYFKLA